MSNVYNFDELLPKLITYCRLNNHPRNLIYLIHIQEGPQNGLYYVATDLPDVKHAYSVVKERYQPVPRCCVNRWYTKALQEAFYRLNNF